MSTPYRIIAVCTGNICRSPMAEFMLAASLAEAGLDGDVVVDSAATSRWEVGNPIDPRAGELLTRHGIDSAGHRARQFDPAWFIERDLILTLDDGHYERLRELAPDPLTQQRIRMLREFDPAASGLPYDELAVADPYYGGRAGFDDAWTLISAALEGIVAHCRQAVNARN